MNRFSSIVAAGAILGAAYMTEAAVVVEYDAATAGAGVEPNEVSPAWTGGGTAMTNNGTFLLQDNTANDPSTQSGDYTSPSAGAGAFLRTSGAYGLEFRVRPITDVPFLGASHYANAILAWSDDQFTFNVTIDKFTDDSSGTGGLKYGQNSMSDAVLGIDWSAPHTIFIGHTGVAGGGTFQFYVDGVLQAPAVGYGSIARTITGWEFAQNKIYFGDGTTGQGQDEANEWYSLRIHNTAEPIPEPAGVSLLLGAGLLGLSRRRS